MQFSQLAALIVAAASAVSATNTMTFVNQDSTNRKIIFTPNAGLAEIDSVDVAGNDQVEVEIPQGWIGNAYSVSEGAEDVVGMLAEVTFQGWNDLTYYDVSAIVNPADKDGVKQMYPATEITSKVKASFSGCLVFPCSTAYYVWDDVQTASTSETDLIVTLGSSSNETLVSRDDDVHLEGLVTRNYVLGKL
ncbi:DNase1 protein [Xylariomycetidae sp. FL2044]|nr:DNase1 protein [Xylariomycetidae sp. FL2044]